MELRCVVAVIRHGDRTPKQKMKMEVSHPHFFDIFKKYKGFQTGKIKLKKPRQLQEVLDVARMLVEELKSGSQTQIICEKMTKLEQLKTVLEMYGHFSGKLWCLNVEQSAADCPLSPSWTLNNFVYRDKSKNPNEAYQR